MSKSRNIVYDWLRVIATLMVLIGHSSYLKIHTELGGISYILPENINPVYYSLPFTLLRKLSGAVYGFHMPMFFMLSGAVLAINDDKDFDSFVASKIKRLIIPYFVCGLGFMLPVKYLGNFYSSDNFMAVMRSFLIGGESGHLWFLPALFWCTVSFSIIRRLLLRKGVKSVYAITLLCVICVSGGGGIMRLNIAGFSSGMRYMFWFTAGYAFEVRRKYYPSWSTKRIIAVLIAVTFMSAGAIVLRPESGNFIIIAGCVWTYLAAVLCARLFPEIIRAPSWQLLIRNLFAVYLFHDPLEYVVLRIFMNTECMREAAGCVAYALSRTLLILAVSIILGESVSAIRRRINDC